MSRLIRVQYPVTYLNSSYTIADGGPSTSIPLGVPYPIIYPHFAVPVAFDTTSDLSAVHFTITGTDEFGNFQTEVVTGANDIPFYSVLNYNTVTNISSDGAYTNLIIGSGLVGFSQWIPVNNQITPAQFMISTEVFGSVTYSVSATVENINEYKTTGPSFRPFYPILTQLGPNPIATTNGSATIVVTVPTTGYLKVGDFVTLIGATTVNSITAAQINQTYPIVALTPTTFTLNTTGTATPGAAGGGNNVGYYFKNLPFQFETNAALTNATTGQVVAYTGPVTGFQVIIDSTSTGFLTVDILQAGIN